MSLNLEFYHNEMKKAVMEDDTEKFFDVLKEREEELKKHHFTQNDKKELEEYIKKDQEIQELIEKKKEELGKYLSEQNTKKNVLKAYKK